VWTLEGVEQAEEKLEKDATGEIGIKREIEVKEAITELQQIEESPEDEWDNWYRELVIMQTLRGYSKGWIYYKLVEAKPPLRIWLEFAAYRGYKPGWAKYRYEEQCQESQESA
jgi:hypothetical protein